MASTRRILLLCHSFPPVYGIGGRRWAKFAKELARRGHALHVLRADGHGNRRKSLWEVDVQQPGIESIPLRDHYPAVMRKWPLIHLGEKIAYRFWLGTLPLLTKGNYYDYGFTLRKQAVAQGRRIIREKGITHIVATGAPFSFLRYAALLKEEFPAVQLVVDFRDEWATSDHYGMGSLSERRRKRELRMEEFVVRASDRVISPSELILAQLQQVHQAPVERFVHIPHAIDPSDFDFKALQPDDGIFRMIYAGSLYGGREVEGYFSAVMDAFDALRRESPGRMAKVRFDLYITGHDFGAYQQRVHQRGLAEQITFHDPLPSKKILQRIQAADLMINYFPPDKKDVISTKFHEVFYLHRPILHVGPQGRVSRMLQEQKLGAWLTVDQLRTELPKILKGERMITVDPLADFQGLLLTNVTDRLLDEVLV